MLDIHHPPQLSYQSQLYIMPECGAVLFQQAEAVYDAGR